MASCDICDKRIYEEGINVCCSDEVKEQIQKLKEWSESAINYIEEINRHELGSSFGWGNDIIDEFHKLQED